MNLQEKDAASPLEAARRPWYAGATRGQWLALLAALLGWGFDGFEQGVFPLVARPALVQLQPGLGELDQQARDPIRSEEERQAARAAVDEPVRRWNGAISAAFLVGAALGGLVFGWLGDRLGRVRAMIFSVLTYALFTGFCGLAQTPWQLVALRFLAALGMGGEWALGVALVMESWSSHARPVLAGLIGAAANLGFLATGLLGLALRPDAWWRWIFLVCVLPALLTFLLRMFVPESAKWEHATASGPRPRMRDIFVPGLRGRALLGMSLGAVALLATWGAVQWLPLLVGQTRKDLTPYVNIFSPLGACVGAFLGAILGARLSRRLGYFALCTLSLAMCELLFVGLAGYPIDVTFFAVVTLVGACSAAFYGWLPLYLPELFPTRVRATGQGFSYNGGRILAAVGVLLNTFALDLRGNYSRAAALVCLVYLVGMGLAWLLPETRGQPLPE